MHTSPLLHFIQGGTKEKIFSLKNRSLGIQLIFKDVDILRFPAHPVLHGDPLPIEY